ncbi:MAG: hypothetical protein ACK4TA_11425 [Saprospiraceae bacterium]
MIKELLSKLLGIEDDKNSQDTKNVIANVNDTTKLIPPAPIYPGQFDIFGNQIIKGSQPIELKK